MVPIPRQRVIRLVELIVIPVSYNKECAWLLLGISMPKICFNWFKPIIIAAADVNPLITGFDKKLTKKPSLKIPKANCISPIRNANRIAAAI